MSASELLKEIFEKNTVLDPEGVEHPLVSNVSRAEGEFLQQMIREVQPSRTIEIGCAYGISSLYICGELQKSGQPHHTIIDAFQSTQWKNIGITNLKRAGIDFFELIEKKSEIALPELLAREKEYDLGLIDGWHTFDHTLIDFFYLNRLIRVGGVIIIDDINFPGINKFVRYVLNYPCYEMVGRVKSFAPRRELENVLTAPLRLGARLLPKKLGYKIFAGKVVRGDFGLKLNSTMIALKKVAEDERSWKWFEDF